MKKRLFILLVSLIVLFGLKSNASFAAEPVVYSGTYAGFSYKVTGNEALGYSLYFYGNGEIPDSVDNERKPYAWSVYGGKDYSGKIKNIYFDNGITRIPARAFRGYSKLEHVYLGLDVAIIGEYAFELCTTLAEIDFKDAVVTVDRYAFTNCVNLKKINLGKRLRTIYEGAFCNNRSLVDIDIPASVQEVGFLSFMGCDALQSINFARGVGKIGGYAFKDCASLKDITINGVSTVSSYAFSGCKGLESVIFTDGVLYLEGKVFEGCSSLKSVTLPESIVSIGVNAIPNNVEINGYEGTIASTYATENGNAFYNMKGRYNVIFFGNGATDGSTETMRSVVSAEKVSLRKNGFAKKGYTYTGWNTKPDGTGTAYADEAFIKGLGDNGANIELYAQWSINTYSISYEMNGGKNSEKNPSKFYVNSKEIIFEDPQYYGYVFMGWFSDSSFNNQVKSIPTDTAANIKVYAKWVPVKYSIVFEGNGATSGSTSAMEGVQYLDSIHLTINGFERKGYSFIEWNTDAEGKGKSYKDEEVISELAGDGETVTLYAIWQLDTYLIEYDLDGGKNNAKNPASYTVLSETITLKNPTKKGYYFDGWYLDEKYVNVTDSIVNGSAENVKLHAKWKPYTYTIKFKGNGADSGKRKTIKDCKYGASIKLGTGSLRKLGYTLTGWSTKPNGKGKVYKSNVKVKNLLAKDKGEITLYAVWEKTKYKIYYHLPKDAKNGKNPSSFNYDTPTFSIAAPTRNGYTFYGWYKDKKLTRPFNGKVEKGTREEISLYPKFIVNTYNVIFSSNLGYGKMDNMMNVKYFDKVKLPKNTYQREGYTFAGWNTRHDGAGMQIKDGATISKLAQNKDVLLYAQWKVIR